MKKELLVPKVENVAIAIDYESLLFSKNYNLLNNFIVDV
jgi:hypothetical protein